MCDMAFYTLAMLYPLIRAYLIRIYSTYYARGRAALFKWKIEFISNRHSQLSYRDSDGLEALQRHIHKPRDSRSQGAENIRQFKELVCPAFIRYTACLPSNSNAILHLQSTNLSDASALLLMFNAHCTTCSWTYPTAECVDSVGLTLMRNALLEPSRVFTSDDLLGVFLILLVGVILAFIVAGINRVALFVFRLYREVGRVQSAAA